MSLIDSGKNALGRITTLAAMLALGATSAGCETADATNSPFAMRVSALSKQGSGDGDHRAGERRGSFNAGVVPPQQPAYETTYADLAGGWWSWGIGLKATGDPATNPVIANGSVDCSLGQSGPVWFLAGNFGGTSMRRCRVPADKALFLPLLNQLFIHPDEAPTTEAVRKLANQGANGAGEMRCEVDGQSLGDLFAYRAQSPPGGFALRVEKGSLLNGTFGLPAGDRPGSVADGFWILLKPLSRGRHVVHFAGKSGDPAAPSFELDVTYELMVGGHDDH